MQIFIIPPAGFISAIITVLADLAHIYLANLPLLVSLSIVYFFGNPVRKLK